MNVLLITNNFFQIKENKIYTDTNTCKIIERFSYLGKIRICGVKFPKYGTMKLDRMDLVAVNDVVFTNKARMFSDRKTLRIIELEVKKSDLVIGYQSPCVNAESALSIAKKYKKKYMSYVVACAWDGLWNHGIIGKICAPYRFFSLKKIVKESDYVLYVTNDFLQRRYPNNGINVGCSDVIINTNDSVLQKRLHRVKQFDSKPIIKLITVASLNVKYKGQQYVIKALAKLKRQGITNIHYYLIGLGTKDYLEKLAKKYGVQKFIHFIGSVSHDKVIEYLDEMDVYIQPSLQEGLPRSVVEAMSRGLLCIGARTAGIPELLEPQYIVERKSVGDIMKQLTSISKEQLTEQAVRNYNKSKEYSKAELDKKRKIFFDRIKAHMINNNLM